MNLPTKDDGLRPNGKLDECIYCKSPEGAHADDCVCLNKSVVVKMTIEMIIAVPRSWDSDNVEFYLNESSSCANNVLKGLHKWTTESNSNCICRAQDTVFIREATEQDHETLPLAGLSA